MASESDAHLKRLVDAGVIGWSATKAVRLAVTKPNGEPLEENQILLHLQRHGQKQARRKWE